MFKVFERHAQQRARRGSPLSLKRCAISKASASLMTDFVKGKTCEEIGGDFDRFHELVTSSPGVQAETEGLGKLAVFAGIREYPMRVKCATLAWHALRAALDGEGRDAKTE